MKMLTGLLLVCAMMAVTNAAGESSVCPSGWAQYYGRCFLFVGASMTWADAEMNCQARGGHLASVHRFDEYYFIQGMIVRQTGMYPKTWLGGSDAQQERTWLWSDGSYYNFGYWCPGEPNNQYGNQHCLQMNFGDQKCWDDLQCYSYLPFVCAKTLESCLG
uniref:C-type lectin domain-containing protein n=1 Tax=Labrus bergylta TaxID=56723 RepID=A0A3Q3N4A3_9LABR